MSMMISPYKRAAAITPHDSTNMPATDAIYVGGAGNFVAIVDGAAITFTGALAGTIYPIRATRINSTDTTATALVALFV